MRLIDADRLLSDRAKSTYYHLPNGDTAIPIIDIEHAQTVDAVEVVRCKDCKYNYGLTHDGEFNPEDIVCTYFETDGMQCYDFCSYAERRDG